MLLFKGLPILSQGVTFQYIAVVLFPAPGGNLNNPLQTGHQIHFGG